MSSIKAIIIATIVTPNLIQSTVIHRSPITKRAPITSKNIYNTALVLFLYAFASN